MFCSVWQVADNSDGLFFYLLFLRLIPMSPNWFLNIGSAIVGIPVPLFFFSVLFGKSSSSLSTVNIIFFYFSTFFNVMFAILFVFLLLYVYFMTFFTYVPRQNWQFCWYFAYFSGLMPYNFISVQTGVILSEIRSIDQVFTTSRMLQLLMLAVLFLTPGLIKRKLFRQKQRDKTV